MNKKKYLRYGLTGILILFYLVMFFVLRERIADPSALLAAIEELYAKYGYAVVFLGGLLEGIFLVGMYVPGSTVILLGAVLTQAVFLPLVIFFGVSGLMIGYCINYVLGKYGWYMVLANGSMLKHLEQAKTKLQKYEKKTFLFGFSSPFLATFLTTAAGVLRLPFKQFIFLAFIIQLLWTTTYSLLAYFFGMGFIEIFIRYFGIVMVVLLFVWGRRLFHPNRSE